MSGRLSDLQWICFESDAPSNWAETDFREFVGASRWIFARTMPQNPHEYTLRKHHGNDVFESAVRYIREHGHMEEYWGKPYKVLHFDGHMYWTMGAELPITILINRKALRHSDQQADLTKL